jgi:hypothetical protein
MESIALLVYVKSGTLKMSLEDISAKTNGNMLSLNLV